MQRRTFIQKSAALGLGGLVFTNCKMEVYQKIGDFGVQLWSVRHLMDQDVVGTLSALANMGYTDIESAGYNNGLFYNMQPSDFKKLIEDLGLQMQSSHTGTGTFRPDQTHMMTKNWEAVCEDAAEVGAKSLICGYFDEQERKTIDDFKQHAELFNQCGEVAKQYGLIFGHHNHDYEFLEIDGQRPYDVLLSDSDPDKVIFELDLYWIRKGNADAFEYFKNHPGRFPIWHVKDMDDTDERFFTEVGSGVINWEEIFKQKAISGMQYFYVEQDEFKKYQPLESLEVSHDYLKELKY